MNYREIYSKDTFYNYKLWLIMCLLLWNIDSLFKFMEFLGNTSGKSVGLEAYTFLIALVSVVFVIFFPPFIIFYTIIRILRMKRLNIENPCEKQMLFILISSGLFIFLLLIWGMDISPIFPGIYSVITQTPA